MRPFIIVMATVLLLTGCSGGDGADGSPDASDGGPQLTDFIPGATDWDGPGSEADLLAQERQAQEKIAACMAEQGFEYIPYVPSQDRIGFVGAETEEEFVAQYGFGIATTLLEDQRMSELDEAEMDAEMAKDPNHAIVQAMTEAEQQAYYEALYGEEPDIDFESMTEEEIQAAYEALEPTGCQNTAYEETYDEGGAQREFFEQFGSMMEDAFAGLESDPRIVELKSKWSSCMADRGYDFTDRNDAERYVLRRLEEVGALTGLEIESEGMGFSYGTAEIEPGSPVEAAVKEIASEEIAIAKAGYECEGDLEDVYREVYEEAEQRFIEEHLAELEQFKKEHS